MTPREAAAYNAGIELVRQMAMAAAVTMETRDDATDVRKQAAVAALSALAEGARSLLISKDEAAETRTGQSDA